MMAALSSLTAGKSPAAANPDRVAAQDGEAADTDVLLSSGETPFANLLEGELPQASDSIEATTDEVSESEEVDSADPLQPMLQAAAVPLLLLPELAANDKTQLVQSGVLSAIGLSSADSATGVVDASAAQNQPGIDLLPDLLAKTELELLDGNAPNKAEIRTLSSSLLALGVPALREAQADSRVEWAAVPLVPQAEGGKPQALQQLLAERLAVQSSHGMDRALIRLDPPRFGAVEISLQQEGGRLLVQLTASHGEVVRQLQGIGDVLRQELGQRQFHSVQVDIRHGMHDSQQQQQGSRQQAQQEAQPGRALQLDEDGSSGSFAAEKEQV